MYVEQESFVQRGHLMSLTFYHDLTISQQLMQPVKDGTWALSHQKSYILFEHELLPDTEEMVWNVYLEFPFYSNCQVRINHLTKFHVEKAGLDKEPHICRISVIRHKGMIEAIRVEVITKLAAQMNLFESESMSAG